MQQCSPIIFYDALILHAQMRNASGEHVTRNMECDSPINGSLVVCDVLRHGLLAVLWLIEIVG